MAPTVCTYIHANSNMRILSGREAMVFVPEEVRVMILSQVNAGNEVVRTMISLPEEVRTIIFLPEEVQTPYPQTY